MSQFFVEGTGGGGSGDVTGPASSTDNAIARFNGTSGKTLQNSAAKVDDSGTLTTADVVITNTEAFAVPGGTTAQRPGTPVEGDLRKNTSTNGIEYYNGSTWQDLTSASSTEFSDATFRIYDDGDNTAKIAFEAAAITTSTVRTITMPDQDVNLTPTTGTFQASDADLTAISALTGTGILARTGAATYSERTIQQPAAGITVTNGDGVSGDPTLALADDLAALEGLASTGIAVRSASNTWVQRSVAGTTDEIAVSNGDGVSGNPTVGIADNAQLPGTEGINVAGGTTLQRPGVPVEGDLRKNTDTNQLEYYNGTAWVVASAEAFPDNTFRIYDNGDDTKQLAFEVSAITTATTRTATVPDQDLDLTPTTGTYQGSDADLTAISALSGTGLLSRTGAATYAERTIQQPAAGITVTNGDGVSGDPTLALADDLAAVEGLATSGVVTRTGASTWAATTIADRAIVVGDAGNLVQGIGPLTDGQLLIGSTAGDPAAASLTAPAAGVTITGGANSVTFALADDLAAVEGLASTGMAARTASNTWTTRTITATAGETSVSDGDGVAGNPTIGIADNAQLPGTEGINVAGGTTAQRPGTPIEGDLRKNTSTNVIEYYDGSTWVDLTSGGGGSSPLTTKGDLYTYDTADARLPVGSNDLPLVADSAQTTGLKYAVLTEAGGGTAQSTYTTGDMLYASASNTLSKLDIGDHYPNIIVQNSSGVPQWKQDHLLLENDFLGLGGWQYDNNSGTGLFTTGVSGHPGIFTLGTSTSASGRAILSCGTTTSTPPYIFAGDGLTVFDAIVRIPTLSTVSEEFELFIGFMTSTAFSTPPGSNVICFRYDRTTSTNWDGLCISAGSSTTASGGTGTAVDTNWTHLRFIINAGGTNVDFFVDGVDIGSVTTNIPTSTGMVISNYIFKTAGTTQRTVNIDYNRVYKELTTSRFV